MTAATTAWLLRFQQQARCMPTAELGGTPTQVDMHSHGLQGHRSDLSSTGLVVPMQGDIDGPNSAELQGIVPRAVRALGEGIAADTTPGVEWEVRKRAATDRLCLQRLSANMHYAALPGCTCSTYCTDSTAAACHVFKDCHLPATVVVASVALSWKLSFNAVMQV